MGNNTNLKNELKGFIANLQNYLGELESGSLSEDFVSERIAEMIESYKLIKGKSKKDQKTLQKAYEMNTERMNLSLKRNELMAKIRNNFEEYGVNAILRETKMAIRTYERIRRNEQDLKMDTLVEYYDKIEELKKSRLLKKTA